MSRKTETASTPETVEQAAQADKRAAHPQPCVYCGPTVPNVARQYTVYSHGIPKELEAFIQEHPAARGMLVSVERFPEMRKRLDTPGTVQAVLYQKIRAEM